MEEGGGGGFRLSAECLDEPPNSRVFLVLGKDTGEALIRERFAPFGEIQDIWLVRDKRTHESRGIAFVKFARSSQACRAMEEMHGRSLAPDTQPIPLQVLRPENHCGREHSASGGANAMFPFSLVTMFWSHEALYKLPKTHCGKLHFGIAIHDALLCASMQTLLVFIAQSRASGSHRDVEDEELTRIFVMIPKSYTEEDLRNKFKVYGDIEYCSIIKKKTTGESKGLGYVRYLKPSQAALAIEECDRSYRAILAEPKSKPSESSEREYYGSSSSMRQEPVGHDPGPRGSVFPFEGQPEFGSFEKSQTRVRESVSKRLSVVSRLPFIQEQLFFLFDLVPGLEYCDVQRDPHTNHVTVESSPALALSTGPSKCLLEVDKEGEPYSGSSSSQLSQPQTDAVLPSRKKKVPPETSVKERLFIVFYPHPLPVNVLEDVFCRFGHLIEVYLVTGKNVGYAKFADRTSASDAITSLHGKIVNGVRLKVMLADSPAEESNKRQRTY
ncbi:RNA-binding protein 45 [Chelonia mydas]|uniref:RNA-binding protein 45 n=1 Tax=Chelonia mydas TaxID=8469 RepID=M7BSJ7_CHEMY|nr:RNA-binding protein 45 [Chelonia mydas]